MKEDQDMYANMADVVRKWEAEHPGQKADYFKDIQPLMVMQQGVT